MSFSERRIFKIRFTLGVGTCRYNETGRQMLAWSAIVLLRLVLRCTRELIDIIRQDGKQGQADAFGGKMGVVFDKARA